MPPSRRLDGLASVSGPENDASSSVAAVARRRRREAARRYKPEQIDTLLVAEAPPTALDRYFYFDDVQTQDSLFRHVECLLKSHKAERSPQELRIVA